MSEETIFRLQCTALSLLLALSIAVASFVGVSTALLRNGTYVATVMKMHSEELLERVNNELELVSESADLPAEALTASLSRQDMEKLLTKTGRNFAQCYDVDFSDNTEIYQLFVNGITAYCDANGKTLSADEISADASLAADAVNYVLSSNDAGEVRLFGLVRRSLAVAVTFGALLLGIICIGLIDFINFGRHRKYNDIGTGIVSAGFALVMVGVFVRFSGYIEGAYFCQFEIYNAALQDACLQAVNVQIAIGVGLVLLGWIMLIRNYLYLARKKRQREASKEQKTLSKNEYMEQLQESTRKSVDKSKKNSMKIDFE